MTTPGFGPPPFAAERVSFGGGGGEPPMRLAPIVKSFPDGAVFKGAGISHFTAHKGKFHLTEDIPGVGGLKFRYKFDGAGNIIDTEID